MVDTSKASGKTANTDKDIINKEDNTKTNIDKDKTKTNIDDNVDDDKTPFETSWR